MVDYKKYTVQRFLGTTILYCVQGFCQHLITEKEIVTTKDEVKNGFRECLISEILDEVPLSLLQYIS
ncbi:hypothetical protein KUTeg_002650 [Tegillarca granosa]|uniref:Uncharacterized protein n=1 Tax=Tegillarca granosa TaxID=220873 RepID=A0ABQ9FUX3_TEGGR|nr:hypothetical protein KUTeg_002650 [Tegillarca granosa]